MFEYDVDLSSLEQGGDDINANILSNRLYDQDIADSFNPEPFPLSL